MLKSIDPGWREELLSCLTVRNSVGWSEYVPVNEAALSFLAATLGEPFNDSGNLRAHETNLFVLDVSGRLSTAPPVSETGALVEEPRAALYLDGPDFLSRDWATHGDLSGWLAARRRRWFGDATPDLRAAFDSVADSFTVVGEWTVLVLDRKVGVLLGSAGLHGQPAGPELVPNVLLLEGRGHLVLPDSGPCLSRGGDWLRAFGTDLAPLGQVRTDFVCRFFASRRHLVLLHDACDQYSGDFFDSTIFDLDDVFP